MIARLAANVHASCLLGWVVVAGRRAIRSCATGSYPLVGDSDLTVAKLYGMLPADAGTKSQARTAATNQTVRSVFVIDPAKKIRLILTYPMATGRNFQDILRVIDSLQLTDKHRVAPPAN